MQFRQIALFDVIVVFNSLQKKVFLLTESLYFLQEAQIGNNFISLENILLLVS